MLLGRFFHMMGRLKVVPRRQMREMARLLRFAGAVGFRRRPVIFGRLLMMLSSFAVMLYCWMNR